MLNIARFTDIGKFTDIIERAEERVADVKQSYQSTATKYIGCSNQQPSEYNATNFIELDELGGIMKWSF